MTAKEVGFEFVYYLFLRPLIRLNFRLRVRGLIKDDWFWADRWASNNGYYTTLPELDREDH